MATRRREHVEPEQGAVERALERLDHALIYRYPHIAGPLFLAGAGLGVTAGAHAAAARWAGAGWVPWAVIGLAAVVVLLGLEVVGHLPGRREQAWAVFMWVGGGAWVCAAAWWGPFTGGAVFGWPPLLAGWLLLLVVGWPPWFKHRRVRRGVEVSAEILAWDGDAVGLPGVNLVASGSGADGHSWWARLRPEVKGSYTLAKLRRAIPHIAARYDAAIADVAIEPVRDGHEGEYLLRMQTRSRDAAATTYAPPTEAPSLRVPFEIGLRASGDPLLAELWRKGHGGVDGLIGGQKGYGKTVLLQRMALQALAARDGLAIICDLKPGSPDYAAIGRRAYLYATTPAQIDLVVRVLRVLCQVRGATPRTDRKVLLVLLDETFLYYAPTIPEPVPADVTDPAQRRKLTQAAKREAQQTDIDRQANMDQLVAVSRSADIAVHEAAQRGEEKRMGGAAVRSALLAGQVVGFYSPRPPDSALLSADGEFDLSTLPRGVPGECLISNGQHPDVTRGRMWQVTDEAIVETLERFGAAEGDLHDDELEALGREFGLAWGELRNANREPRPAAPVVEAEEPAPEQPAGRMTPEQSREHVWSVLAGLDRPASVAEIADRAEKSPTMIRERLRELAEAGRVTVEGRNRWTRYSAVHPPVDGSAR